MALEQTFRSDEFGYIKLRIFAPYRKPIVICKMQASRAVRLMLPALYVFGGEDLLLTSVLREAFSHPGQ